MSRLLRRRRRRRRGLRRGGVGRRTRRGHFGLPLFLLAFQFGLGAPVVVEVLPLFDRLHREKPRVPRQEHTRVLPRRLVRDLVRRRGIVEHRDEVSPLGFSFSSRGVLLFLEPHGAILRERLAAFAVVSDGEKVRVFAADFHEVVPLARRRNVASAEHRLERERRVLRVVRRLVGAVAAFRDGRQEGLMRRVDLLESRDRFVVAAVAVGVMP
mmetsp:Transcript_4559/g.18580  ORF Transcript_4559/g.18580 Transcript_4559/m.18580 type:complete len:212 (+) Transcript_4559:1391-2026(+)